MDSYFIDTNYFVRLATKDNSTHYAEVHRLFEQAATGKVHIYTSTIVIFETLWVLGSFYKMNRLECLQILQRIRQMAYLEIEQSTTLDKAIDYYGRLNLSFEDCYHLAYMQQKPGTKLATFDQKLRKIFQTISS